MSAKKTWTPYGLEAIRIATIRRRRLFSVMIAVGLAGLWLASFQVTTTSGFDIYTNGEKQSSGISIDPDTGEEKRDGPVSVALSPGRVTRASTGEQTTTTSASTQRVQAPTFQRAAPLPYAGWLIIYGPFALLALALWFLAKRRGKHDEVNYGVYKGALPYEMISANQSNRIFTSRYARASVFGKRSEDHLPRDLRTLERVEQEDA